MKPIIMASWMAAICVTTAAAQSTTETTRTKTKVKVDGGKEVTVVGCVAENPGGGYMLTNEAGGMHYALVGGDDIAKHLGHRVEVKGKATDSEHGKVKIESKEKTNRADTTHEKSEMKGVHALSVKSVKMLASSCR
jgi:hypothetical protein